MNNKITFPELVSLVASATNTTQRMSELFLKELFATISQALINGERVTVKHLGTFDFVPVAARKSVSVRTGEHIEIPSHNKLIFVPDKALSEAINQPFAAFEPITLSDELTDEMLRDIDTAPDHTDEHPTDETKVLSGSDETPEPAAEAEPADEEPELTSVSTLMPPPFAHSQEAEQQVTTPQDEGLHEAVSENDANTDSEAQVEATTNSAIDTLSEPNLAAEANVRPTVETSAHTSHEFEDRTVQHYSLAEFERTKRQVAHQSFLKGMLTGAVAMLALVGIIWSAMNHHDASQQAIAQADTISEQASSPQPTESVVRKNEQKAAEHPQTSVVTDTCTATMYLSKMSRKHYGKPDFWIYIYEENRDKIADPNNVTPGTVVVIPAASKYNIDPNDKSSVDRARKRTYELLSQK